MEFKNGIVAQKSLLNKKRTKVYFFKKILVSNDDYTIILWYNKIFFLNLKIIQANKPRLKKIWLKLQPFCLGGETGRRARLKIWYGQPCVGSSPTRGTTP